MTDQKRHEILERSLRFGLTIPSDVHRHVMPDVTLNAVRKALSKLEKEQWLTSYPLPGRERYFVPGKRAIRAMNLDPRKGMAYGPQALPTRVGVLLFCSEHASPQPQAVKTQTLIKPTAEEFKAVFPELNRPGLPSQNYVFETGDTHKIGWLHVDHGAEPQKVIDKLRKIVRVRRELPAFKEAILRGEFFITVLVPSEERGKQLHRKYQKRTFRFVDVRFVAIPELLTLLVSEGN